MELPPKAPVFRVKVDEECIERAIPEDSGNCMISDAIRKCYPETKYVSTDLYTIRLTENGWRRVYWLPEECRQALLDFDNGIKPKPFEFVLDQRSITQTVASKRATTNKKVMQRQEYEPIRMALVKTVTEKQNRTIVPIQKLSKENDIAPKSMGTYLSPRGTIPSVKVTKKVLNWAKDNAPETPLGKIAEQKIQELEKPVIAPVKITKQLRPETATTSTPEQLGGKIPPHSRLGMRRVFGRRDYSRPDRYQNN